MSTTPSSALLNPPRGPTCPKLLGVARWVWRPQRRPRTGEPVNDNSVDEVIYHGYHCSSAGVSVVAIETERGEQLGLLHHVVRYSPTGLNWGYQGSGPADLARSLLIAALGDHARCPACAGTAQLVGEEDRYQDEPFNRGRAATYDPELVQRCLACDDGYRPLPYQDFQREHVATWGNQWRMRRADIRAWLALRGDLVAGVPR